MFGGCSVSLYLHRCGVVLPAPLRVPVENQQHSGCSSAAPADADPDIVIKVKELLRQQENQDGRLTLANDGGGTPREV